MSETEKPEWGEDEARALRGLSEPGEALPSNLKPKVVERLAGLGLLSTARPSRSLNWAPLAAAAAFAILGFAVGRGTSASSGATALGTRYVLLLTGAASVTPAENEARRQEYGAWLSGLQRRGMVADGAELVTPRHDLPGDGRSGPVVGYFIINAKDETEALDIAKANPHLRHGGGVTLAALR
jgi:hypothetical protein